MKKLGILLIALTLLISVTACGSSSDPAATPANEGESPAASDSGDTYIIRVGHVLQEDTASHIALDEGFKQYVEANSGGRIEVQLYPNSALGGERQLVESAQLGTLEIAYVTTAVLANFEPKVQVFDLPFLFNDIDIARKALDSELGDLATEDLPSVGLRNLAYGENGFRHVSNNKGPITTPDDLKGIKIRTMENPFHMKAFQALGATPTPLSFNELYTALQQGTVDAQENPIFLTYTSKFYEVQDYLTLTGHVYAPGINVISDDFWNSLPADLQEIVQQGAYEFRDMQRDILDQQNAEYLEELRSLMEVNDLTAEQKALFVEATLDVYGDVAAEVGQDLVDLAVAANATFG